MDFLFLEQMKIGIDMMGGDYAPLEAAKGVISYLKEGTADLVLVGDETAIQAAFEDFVLPPDRVRIELSTQVIGMHEHPTKALKEKSDSSISRGFRLLATGGIDAFISAGNTGAMLVGSLYSLK